jgi:histidinol dehydrogenase
VQARVQALLATSERRSIIEASLAAHGALILTRDLAEAAQLASELAPEHLELAVAEPQALLAHVRHAGAIFMGAHSPEAIGDYCAGPNHVLPTARTARFSSPLGVYDFQKRSSLIALSAAAAATLAPLAAELARGEGLTAHARSAECRLEPPP